MVNGAGFLLLLLLFSNKISSVKLYYLKKKEKFLG